VCIRILAAYNLRNRDTGILGDVSDPYVVVRAGSAKHQTPVINNDLNPVWDHDNEFEFPLNPEVSSLEVEVWNSNMLRDNTLGRTSVVLSHLLSGQKYRRREKLEVGGNGGELEFEVTKVVAAAEAPDEVTEVVAAPVALDEVTEVVAAPDAPDAPDEATRVAAAPKEVTKVVAAPEALDEVTKLDPAPKSPEALHAAAVECKADSKVLTAPDAVAATSPTAAATMGGDAEPSRKRNLEAEIESLARALDLLRGVREKQREYLKLLQINP